MDNRVQLAISEIMLGGWVVIGQPYLLGGGWFNISQVVSVNDTHIGLKLYRPCDQKGLALSGFAIRKIESVRSGAKPIYVPSSQELFHITRFRMGEV